MLNQPGVARVSILKVNFIKCSSSWSLSLALGFDPVGAVIVQARGVDAETGEALERGRAGGCLIPGAGRPAGFHTTVGEVHCAAKTPRRRGGCSPGGNRTEAVRPLSDGETP